MKLFITIITLLSTTFLFAQKRITVTDPEIEFSYELPKKWKYEDDGYYVIAFSPYAIESEYLQITYTESGTANLEEHFTFIIDKLLPVNEIDFELIEKGHLEGVEKKIQYGIFDSKIGGIKYRNLIYLFIESGQTFQIRGMALPYNFKKFKNQYRSITLSIQSKSL